jgi:dihydroorotate dehydrogenase
LSRAFDALARRALFLFEPETAHRLAIGALRSGLLGSRAPEPDARLAVRAAGLAFPNPLGLAAGFDKDAEVPDALLGLGFGFVEVGTVTPRPQKGNPRPRVFRLEAERAVINRLGFNNRGHDACAARLAARPKAGIVGVNIGANKSSADRIADYERGVRRFAPLAAYLTVNVSSPNTPGLRDLQARESLRELLGRVMGARGHSDVPVFLKIAPDLSEAELEDVASEAAAAGIAGAVVSNTTLARPLPSDTRHAGEAGGLSGRPLFERSTATLARMRRFLGPEPALIAAGGVDSGEAALEKVRAGADLVQLYTGFVFGGPGLPSRILGEMSAALGRDGAASLRAVRDSRIDHWAARPL